jgi:hypothetical protein
MNRKFKAPPAVDIKQWAKVQFLSEHGFRFGSIVDEDGYRVPYPKTLQEARKFVREYTDVVGAGWLPDDAPPKGKRIPGRTRAKRPRVRTAHPQSRRTG